MQISGISNNLLGPINTSVHSQSKQSINTGGASTSDSSVTLSPEAMAEFEKLAAYTEQAGEYLPKVTVLNNSDSHKIGYSAWAESFQDTYKNELSEYGDKFKEYYEETKIDHGIFTENDHYEKVLSLKGGNIEFQQSFEDKLKGDTKMLELMSILGIKPPA
jgi:hypothetical protein